VRGFKIGIDWTGDAVHLRVRGELDIAVADRLVAQVQEVRESSARVALVDLHDVTFMDSSGLRALLSAQRLSRDGDDFDVILVRVSDQVRDVIGITRAEPFLRIAPDAGAALDGAA
jgi:anti-sigma B factor antagonist